MTPDVPNNPRSELEARLTALLLGELPADEAADLRERIAQDVELAKLHAQLEHTIELVRETAATPADESADQPAPLRLSGDRREKLLARFKTAAPKEFAKTKKRKVSWMVPMAAAVFVALVSLVLYMSQEQFMLSERISVAEGTQMPEKHFGFNNFFNLSRERGSVTTTIDQSDARPAADLALRRAKSEVAVQYKTDQGVGAVTFGGQFRKSAARPESEGRDREALSGDSLADGSRGKTVANSIILPSSTEIAAASPPPTPTPERHGFALLGPIQNPDQEPNSPATSGPDLAWNDSKQGSARGAITTTANPGEATKNPAGAFPEIADRNAFGLKPSIAPPTPAEPPTPSLLAQNELAKETPAKPAAIAGNAIGGAEADQMSRRFYRLVPGGTGGGGSGGGAAPAFKSEISDLPSAPAVVATTPTTLSSPAAAGDFFFTTGTTRDDVAALRQLAPGQPAVAPEVAKDENLIPLEIKLPQPAFKGTPKNVPLAAEPEIVEREKLAESDKNRLIWGAYDPGTKAPQIFPAESVAVGFPVTASPPPNIDPATGLPEPLAAPVAPEVSIKARFADVAQADQKQAAGFADSKLDEEIKAGVASASTQIAGGLGGQATGDGRFSEIRSPAGTRERGASVAGLAKTPPPPTPGAVFLGYDDPGQFVPQAMASANGSLGVPLTAQQPLPHWRVDGKDYHGEPPPGTTFPKDKIPALGDLPMVGRLFRTEPAASGGAIVAGKLATDGDSDVKLSLADGLNQNLALNKSSTLALNGANDFSGGAATANSFVNSGTMNSGRTEADKLSTLSGNVDTSANWNFPTTGFPNVGSLGRVARGTPWQSVYTKDTDEKQPKDILEDTFQGRSGSGRNSQNVTLNRGANATSEALQGPASANQLEPGLTYISPENFENAAKGLSREERAELRKKLDVPTRQVLVEAKLLETPQKNDSTLELVKRETSKASEELEKRFASKGVEQQLAQAAEARIPDTESLQRLPSATEDKLKATTKVRDAAVLFEMRRLDEADAKLKEASSLDPANQQAYYYKNLVSEAKYLEAQNKRDVTSRQGLVEVEEAWATPPKRELTPMPKAYARSTIASTEKGRQSVAHKLDVIHLDSLNAERLPLSEVINNLHDESKKRDPDKKGLNFILSGGLNASDLTNSTQAVLDPATGVPTATVPPSHDFGATAVNIGPPLKDVRLADALDLIVKRADKPIKYSIEDYGVVFSPATPATNTPAKEPEPPKQSRPKSPAAEPQPEVQTCDNSFSTFSLNISDVSFKLALASLEKGQMPDAGSVRSEEFINAFDYRDPDPPPAAPIGYAFERARYPFAQNRELIRFSLKTAALGRQAGRPLNLVLLLDNSGSMERADRVRIIHEALRVLAGQLQPKDKLSVITFARTARLVADGVSGNEAGKVVEEVSGLTPEGGTNLEEAMNTAYATALRHYLADGINRVVLLTDGAANLGNVEPEALKQKVEAHRKQGVALDCFGIGWEGYNDDLLEVLSRNGDGRYGFINSPEEAATEFAGQLAGALHVAASDVKVQIEFNPKRVVAYRQIGYAKHQLTKQQFRDNTVDAAEIAAQEAGNALYVVETNPRGEGPIGTVRVRYKVPGTSEYHEHEWEAPYSGSAVELEQASPAMRLAATASAFSEWLVSSPFAGEVTPDSLLGYLSGVPEIYGADGRPKKLEWAIRQAKSLVGK